MSDQRVLAERELWMAVLQRAQDDFKNARDRIEKSWPMIESLMRNKVHDRAPDTLRGIRKIQVAMADWREMRQWFLSEPVFPILCDLFGINRRCMLAEMTYLLHLPASGHAIDAGVARFKEKFGERGLRRRGPR